MQKTNSWIASVVTALGIATSAQADGGDFAPPQYKNFLAFGVGSYPDYLGSSDNNIGVAPLGVFSLGENRFFSILANSAYLNLSTNENYRFGPTGTYRFGRDGDVDDPVISRMASISNTVEVGGFASYVINFSDDIRDRMTFGGHVAVDVGGEHDGYVASVNVRRWLPVGRFGVLGLAAATTYGSSNYMDTYFSVSPADAMASGLPQFEASSGFRDVRLQAVFMHPISKNWVVGTGVMYSRLLNDAEDSPVVDIRGDSNQFVYGVGIGYIW